MWDNHDDHKTSRNTTMKHRRQIIASAASMNRALETRHNDEHEPPNARYQRDDKDYTICMNNNLVGHFDILGPNQVYFSPSTLNLNNPIVMNWGKYVVNTESAAGRTPAWP
jgi:hypothetical protein